MKAVERRRFIVLPEEKRLNEDFTAQLMMIYELKTFSEMFLSLMSDGIFWLSDYKKQFCIYRGWIFSVHERLESHLPCY